MVVAYIGTYTKKDSQGIYRVEIDERGKVVHKAVVATVANPTYLSISNNEKYLYSVAKYDEKGAVTSFQIEPDGSLVALTSVAQPGVPPCYVEISSDGQYLVSANYHLGTIDSYQVGAHGELVQLLSVDQHHGSSLHPRQDKAHAHFAGFSRDGRFVLTCDLGTDEITTYRLVSGRLERVNNFKFFTGVGVRHLVFSHDERFVFVMTELSSEVIVLEFNAETGALVNPRYYMTLPFGFYGENKGSAIRISQDDRFVYVSNRGLNAIVVFSNQLGHLEKIQSISTFDHDPRDFNLSKDGEWAIAANENGSITVYKVDKVTGLLEVTDKQVPLPEAVCVQFMS